MSFEQTTVVGKLSKDPEMRYTGSGVAMTTFDVPINRSYNKEDGTKVESTTWYHVTTFRKSAENCAKYLVKGSEVLVQGKITARAYMGRDGEPAASITLNADQVTFLSKGNSDQPPTNSATPQPTSDEDIPF